jgi:secernin
MTPTPAPLGCDTLVATASATADGSVLFAKNSDRHPDECQHLRLYEGVDRAAGELRCQYLTIPQASRTYRVFGAQPFWLWGFEHGVNERGVVIGNEAIWTTAPREATGLLGMDLIRLGLERGGTALEALEVITTLLAAYGQGGSPRHDDPAAAGYDNSFLIADPREAWVLETSGRDWVARRVEGVYSISNVPTIGADFDLASPALRVRPGLDFARDLADPNVRWMGSGVTRCARSRALLQQRAGKLTPADMMAFLRDHGEDPEWRPGAPGGATICMHGQNGQTAGGMVVHLRADGEIRVWSTIGAPCASPFLPVFLEAGLPDELGRGWCDFDAESPWWRSRRLLDRAKEDWPAREAFLRQRWSVFETRIHAEADCVNCRSEVIVWSSRCLQEWLAETKRLEAEVGLRKG